MEKREIIKELGESELEGYIYSDSRRFPVILVDQSAQSARPNYVTASVVGGIANAPPVPPPPQSRPAPSFMVESCSLHSSIAVPVLCERTGALNLDNLSAPCVKVDMCHMHSAQKGNGDLGSVGLKSNIGRTA